MFGLGHWEVLLVVFAIVLLFGGKKIPEIAKGLGKGIREFKDAHSGKSDKIENDKDIKKVPEEPEKHSDNEKST